MTNCQRTLNYRSLWQGGDMMLQTKRLWRVSLKITSREKCSEDIWQGVNNVREVITEEECMDDAVGMRLNVNAHKNMWGEAKSIGRIQKRFHQMESLD
jgi:hypothetical protein